MIEQIQPGPQLDAAVAAVLGGEYLEDIASVFWPDGSYEDWKPSQTWNGAGLVVERLAELGWTTQVTAQDGGERIARCLKWEEENGELELVALTDYFECATAPHAISLAALAALGAG